MRFRGTKCGFDLRAVEMSRSNTLTEINCNVLSVNTCHKMRASPVRKLLTLNINTVSRSDNVIGRRWWLFPKSSLDSPLTYKHFVFLSSHVKCFHSFRLMGECAGNSRKARKNSKY